MRLSSPIPSNLLRPKAWGLSALVAIAIVSGGGGDRAVAQMAACQPPNTTEYLMLAVAPTAEAQAKVIALLPVGYRATTCNYLGETVLRVGGFSSEDAAKAWSDYIAAQASVSAFVARPSTPGQPSTLPPLPPSTTPPPVAAPPSTLPIQPGAPSTIPAPAPTPAPAPSNGYNPQPLGQGYAVLVGYGDRPELITQVKQSTGQTVGLVSYGQRPYLLATFTSDAASAGVLLQALSDKGLSPILVEGRRVMLLKSDAGI